MSKNTLPTGLCKRGNVYWLRYMVDGHRTQVSLRTSDISEAITNAKLLRANPLAVSSGTVVGLTEAFIAGSSYTEATRRAAATSLKSFGNYTLTVPIQAIRKRQVQAWFNACVDDSSKATAQTHFYRVRAFFDWAKKKARLIEFNPCADVDIGTVSKGKRTRRRAFCTRAERDTILDKLPRDAAGKYKNPDLAFVLFAGFYAGLRRGEISEARCNWFDLERRMLHVQHTDTFTPKDKEDRTIPIAKPFAAFLAEFDLSGTYCIGKHKHTRGRAIYRYDMRRPFDEYMAALGMPDVTMHRMRKTFASLLVSAGTSIYKVAHWLGDEIRTTEKHYAFLIPQTDEVDKL